MSTVKPIGVWLVALPQDSVLSRSVLEFDSAFSGWPEDIGSGSEVNQLVSELIG